MGIIYIFYSLFFIINIINDVNFSQQAFYESLLIVAATGACCYTFMPINQTAFYLMLLNLVYISFVTCLSYSIWCLNSNSNDTKEK